jgi:hypothetical protein
MKKYPGKVIAISNPDGEILYGKDVNNSENISLTENDIEILNIINIEIFFIKFIITLDIITYIFYSLSPTPLNLFNTIYQFLNLIFCLIAYSGVNTLNQNLLFPYLINFYIFNLINFINLINCNVYIINNYFNNTNISLIINNYEKYDCNINIIYIVFIIYIGYIYQNFYNKIPQYKEFYKYIYYNNLISIY